MKQYYSVQELAQDSVDALKQYQSLMSGSAVILFLATEQNKVAKQQEVMRGIAENIGVTPRSGIATQGPLKETAESLYRKVQEYRQSSPAFVVEMFDEGLGFLEKLCEKYM